MIDLGYQVVKIVVFSEGSMREFVPHSGSSWRKLCLSGTSSLQMKYGGNVCDSTPRNYHGEFGI